MSILSTAPLAFPTNIFSVAATPSHAIRELAILTLVITASVFVVMATLLTVAIVRYRERPGQSKVEPVQIYGSNQIELSWTVIPILIVLVLFLATTRVIIATERGARAHGRDACSCCRSSVLVGVPLYRYGCRDCE